MKNLVVRPVGNSDKAAWLDMRRALWPGDKRSHQYEIDRFLRGELREPQHVILAQLGEQVVGFAELSVRAYAEGCVTDNVGYLEGLYVVPAARRKGVGRALIGQGEAWAKSRGCSEFASDAKIDNELSATIHNRVGFIEVGCIRCFRKTLDTQDTGITGS